MVKQAFGGTGGFFVVLRLLGPNRGENNFRPIDVLNADIYGKDTVLNEFSFLSVWNIE